MRRQIKKMLAIGIVAAIALNGENRGNSFVSYASSRISSTVSFVEKQEAVSESKMKVMPLGDSITAGYIPSEPQFGGYRNTLCDLLENNGYSEKIDFVGKWKTGTGYDIEHSGTNGAMITKYTMEESGMGIIANRVGIQLEIGNLMTTYKPDAVFLEIGTNDILHAIYLKSMESSLGILVDSILSGMNEEGALFMATIPYMSVSSDIVDQKYFTQESLDKYVDDYNIIVRRIAGKKAAEGRKVYLVDINSAVDKESGLIDGVHPNLEGYIQMGVLWYQTLLSYMNGTLPVASETYQSTATPLPAATPISTNVVIPSPTPIYTGVLLPTETPICTDRILPTETPMCIDVLLPTATPICTDEVLPTATPMATQISTITPVPAKINTNIEDTSGNTYKVTKSDFKNGTVEYSKPKSNTKGAVKIPDIVTIKGTTYKVTSVAANAFKGNKNITSVTIGKNIKKIEKNVFNGCTNLKTIIIKTTKLTSTSISAGIFKGLTLKICIKVPKSKLKNYEKLFKKKGLRSKVKIYVNTI